MCDLCLKAGATSNSARVMRVETRAAMQQYGVRSVKELNPSLMRRAT